MKTLNRAFHFLVGIVVIASGTWLGWNAQRLFATRETEIDDSIVVSKEVGRSIKDTTDRAKWPKSMSAQLIPQKPPTPSPEEVMAEENAMAEEMELTAEQIEKLNKIAHSSELPKTNRIKALKILHANLATEGWTLISSDIDPAMVHSIEEPDPILADDMLDDIN